MKNKSRQIRFAKRKHLKQLKRNAKKKILDVHRRRYKAWARAQQIRSAFDDDIDPVTKELSQPELAK